MDHADHDVARSWVAGAPATCPIIEDALARELIRLGESPETVAASLCGLRGRSRRAYWPDDQSYADVGLGGVLDPRKFFCRFLVSLAMAHGGVLATFDKALAARAWDDAYRVPRGASRAASGIES